MSTGTCTRCNQSGEIRLRGKLEWDLPYALCANCYGVYCNLDQLAAARFAEDLWQRSAVLYLEPRGAA